MNEDIKETGVEEDTEKWGKWRARCCGDPE